ncbi:membrane protein [Bacillus safensis]|nr:membrane protein [Bacillus safensis]
MNILAIILVGIVAFEHLVIMLLEMFFMESKMAKRSFKLPEHLQKDPNVKVMFANQGLYNGFLAAGLIWGLILGSNTVGYMIQLFFILCVIIAAVFGGVTSNKSIIIKQGVPAMLALIALLLAI